MKVAKGVLYAAEPGVMRDVSIEREVGNEVINGVYSDRYGKWERRSGERSGGGGWGAGEGRISRRVVREEKNERWRFQMSIKFEKTAVSSSRVSSG